MGHIRHNAIIVTGYELEVTTPAHKKASEIFSAASGRGEKWDVVSPIISSPVNGYYSFFIAPDGSKEGWDSSDAGNYCRKDFISWMKRSKLYLDWVEIQYGDDERQTLIVHHSDEDEEAQ